MDNQPFQPISTTETAATTILSNQGDQDVQPLDFTKVDAYTTFRAEYAFKGNDIIYHFFRPAEHAQDDIYWKEIFKDVFQDVVMAHFDDKYPRLAATYTGEVDSWWLRASDFVDIGDPVLKSEKLFEKLDAALDQALVDVKSKRPLA